MKLKLDVKKVYHLTSLLGSVERVRKIPNLGLSGFESRWSSMSLKDKRQFLSDLRAIIKPYRELITADVTEVE